MSVYVDMGTCGECARANVEVVIYDNSGDEYNPGKICQRCITRARKAFRRERDRIAATQETR